MDNEADKIGSSAVARPIRSYDYSLPASARNCEASVMALTKALAVGRKRRKRGKLWPMPIRESDLGHIYTDATIRPMAGAKKKWTGRFLVETGATDTFAPSSALRRAGIKPAGPRAYELADGTWQELQIGFGVIEVMGQAAGGTVVFAGESEEPLLGVTVLESAGFVIDPRAERLVARTPKRKRRSARRARSTASGHRNSNRATPSHQQGVVAMSAL